MEVTAATFTRRDPVVFVRAGLAGAKCMWECDKPYRPHRRLLVLVLVPVLLVALYVHV